MQIRCAVSSRTGCIRTNNEDMALFAGDFIRDADDSLAITIGPESRMALIVADGMGGYEGGEVASEMACHSFDSFIAGLPCAMTDSEVIMAIKRQWLPDIQTKIVAAAASSPGLKMMGTTFAGLLFYESMIFMVNIGDSRIYRLRYGFLRQLSTDHSLRQLTGDQSIPSNIIYNAIGIERIEGVPGIETVFADVECITDRFVSGDRYMICSDGLSDMLDDHEIETLMESGVDAHGLVDAACRAGGGDNVTVIIADIESDDLSDEPQQPSAATIEPVCDNRDDRDR